MMARRFLCAVGALALSMFLITSAYARADQQEELSRILDRWTDIHWGQDNVAWLVHYPEELVEPWVQTEGARRKMKPAQVEDFRKYFKQEIKSGAATTFMFSIHSYGSQPLSLAPLAQNVALIDSSGKRIKPVAYEKRLDGALAGLNQGFIFFPKQSNDNFKVAVKGLGPGHETIFAFGGRGGSTSAAQRIDTGSSGKVESVTSEKKPPTKGVQPQKEVVVKIPTKPAAPQTKAPGPKSRDGKPDAELPEFAWDDEHEAQLPPVPSAEPPRAPEEPKPIEPSPPKSVDVKPNKSLPAKKEQVLTLFLRSWVDGDSETMYSLLTAESREKISPELFERTVMGDNFRSGLKGGHKVKWQGQTARVTVSKKVLLMRTLDTKSLRFADEGGMARIEW